ncbi:MAG TPA: hypothetical protein GXX28_03775 [Firmicutes bacterium]|nr:hypothetical protein [Bacillota bacterium]
MSFFRPIGERGPLLESRYRSLRKGVAALWLVSLAFLTLNATLTARSWAEPGEPTVLRRLKGPADARALAYPALGRLPYEETRAYFVAGDGTVLKTAAATQRLRHGVYYVPWELAFANLTPRGTRRIYLVHNHPGGDPTLSAYDVRLGSFWAAWAAREGISFDLLALTPTGEYTSLRESGQLQPASQGWALVRDYAGYVGGPLVRMAEVGLRELGSAFRPTGRGRIRPLDLAGDRCYNSLTKTPKWWNWQTR